jgi:hypothetical protein
MKVVLLIAGIGFLLAGLLAVIAGIPVKEFSFGNTLIVTGAVLTSTGMILLGLWTVVRELRNIAEQLGHDLPAKGRSASASSAAPDNQVREVREVREESDFLFSRDQPAVENVGHAEPVARAPSPVPWQETARSRERARSEAPAAPESVEAAPAAKSRRNLMFSSSRRERERAQGGAAGPAATEDIHAVPIAAPPSLEASEVPAATFDGAWPKTERPRAPEVKAPEAPLPRRSNRTPSTFTQATADAASDERHPPAAQQEEPPPVTVLKSGVVDGMAYSLYSDGSIEAQMPEGMMRFASIDELRAYLDQRP